MKSSRENKKKFIVGITGSFGSGKTTVAEIFSLYGAEVIDADKLAHKVIARGTQAYKNILRIFGKEILKDNVSIDRRKLAKVVFNNKILLGKLNSIIHPQVIRLAKARIKLSASKVIVLDAPLLLEAGLNNIIDKLVVVKTNRSRQIRRIKKKTSLSSAHILKRIKFQMPLEKKVCFADFVIDNNGAKKETERQVKKIWEKIRARS